VVVNGDGELEVEGQRFRAAPGSTLFVPIGAVHRASAGSHPLEIIEVQRGDDCREDDIERLADDYGRVPG
jgi:mannose-6-phosphate isomerase-like protein (cupin superfamily)